MTAAEKGFNLAGVIIPFVGVIVAVGFLWNELVSWRDLGIMAVMYVVTAGGVTIGFHRLLTHRSFATPKWLEYAFAGIGSMAVQGPVIAWVADHRKHHAHADQEGDPHSPHTTHGDGASGVLRGLYYAHIGWLWDDWGRADWKKYAPELCEDRVYLAMSRVYVPFVILTFGLPALLGYLLTGTAVGALTGFIWGGLVRIFFVHHVTWSINSVCHFMGKRRFETEDHSTNVFWLALPSLGEAWHHNHHAFPRSAVHGLGRWELDPSAWVISGLEKIGLARNVVRIAPERQAARLAGADSKAPRVATEATAATPAGAGADRSS
ncbi:MAG TPA: fatty acid desaturase [Solirubrobacterales bacterium]|nr:fatty acid desaturase [Solirubrobacterales bacterium]